ncbi:Hypothetical_protein [Hexamita inflata]|uniref:Hypothetical_protein n=1 Tax=Hexamita inflata TaxID=28002 RepID=A0AA86TZ16_9EUKA|nr:Hypothetical protein HINF_LOCUS21436 [Hexamita inflata]
MIDKDDFDRCRGAPAGKQVFRKSVSGGLNKRKFNFRSEELPRVLIFSHLIVIFPFLLFFFFPCSLAGEAARGIWQWFYLLQDCFSKPGNAIIRQPVGRHGQVGEQLVRWRLTRIPRFEGSLITLVWMVGDQYCGAEKVFRRLISSAAEWFAFVRIRVKRASRSFQGVD